MTEIDQSQDARIRADIEALRPQFPETQDLYREAAALLFFRYGITPTGNKLYSYVKKGSMSAPAQALNRFWEELREKSRVRIEHPDLPDELKDEAAQLVAALWGKSQAASAAGYDTLREEALTKQHAAEQQAESATAVATTLALELAQARAVFSAESAAQAARLAESEEARAAAVSALDAARADLSTLRDRHEARLAEIGAANEQALMSVQEDLRKERERAAGERIALMEQTDRIRHDKDAEIGALHKQQKTIEEREARERARAEVAERDLAGARMLHARLQSELDAATAARHAAETERNEARNLAATAERAVAGLMAKLEATEQFLGQERARADRAESARRPAKKKGGEAAPE